MTIAALDRDIADAASLLGELVTAYSPVSFASSFSAEDMVVLDLIAECRLPIEVFTLDTGRLPEETHALIAAARERYGLAIRMISPEAEWLASFAAEHGGNAFYRSVELRKQCCHIRKVEPLHRALAGKRAWVTGLRREQAVSRSGLEILHLDEATGLMKCNPLANWREEDVWSYVRSRHVPYNALYDRGYRSIGCTPCTRAVTSGEDARSGRWWWEQPDTKECGLHVAANGRLERTVKEPPSPAPSLAMTT